jgi:hypothetical protein
MKANIIIGLLVCFCAQTCSLYARCLYVNPATGSDSADGLSAVAQDTNGPVRSIAKAIGLAKAGDTIYLGGALYKSRGEHIGFYGNIAGEPNRPIVVDGQGAIIDGAIPIDPNDWTQVEPGLYSADGEKLFRNISGKANTRESVDALVARFSFIFDGKLNRMNHSVKARAVQWKATSDLQPGEWTYKEPPNHLFGTYFIRLDPSKKLVDYKIEMPVVNSAVQIAGTISHIVFKNITVTHVINDGFALTSGSGPGSRVYNIVYENITAVECCDDGFSSHGDCQNLTVTNFLAEGCSTGVANAGGSSVIDRLTTKNIHGVDVYYLSGTHVLKNSHIKAHGNFSPLKIRALTPAHAVGYPAWNICSVQIENVLFDGTELSTDGSSKVSIEDRCMLDMKRTTFNKISWIISKAASVSLHKCLIIGGGACEIQMMSKDWWLSDENIYDLGNIRIGQLSYDANNFLDYKKATGQDAASKWMKVSFDELASNARQPDSIDKAAGCDMTVIPK